MVSSGLRQVLERARARFGVEMEILDANLRAVYPDGRTDLTRAIDASPDVRDALARILMSGRPERLQQDIADYAFYPLGQSMRRRRSTGLLAIRRPDRAQTLTGDPWSDLARAIIETDLAAAQTIGDERARSRRLLGALRFLDVLAEARDHASLSRALVHAAAVWYDVDARIYRREVEGDFVLDTCLPGVEPHGVTRYLAADIVGDSLAIRRVSPGGQTPGRPGDDAIASRLDSAVVIPLAKSGSADWVLMLIGNVPVEDDPVLRMVAVSAGARVAELDNALAEQTQRTCESLLSKVPKAPELAVVRVLDFLTDAVGAVSGSVLLSTQGSTRRIASVGSTERASEETADAPPSRRLSNRMALGDSDYALLEFVTAPGASFSRASAVIAKSASASLRMWLAGSLASMQASAVLDTPAARPAFAVRIQEELQRARRFDLRLSILLVAVAAPHAVGHVQQALREELRGSDVTGALNSTELAALLTHTDGLGLDHVARRVKTRLAHTAEQLNLSNIRVGQAEVSSDVRSVDALLELAWRQAESVTLH